MFIGYGPNENCTLALCPVNQSVYEYRPSLAANVTFIVLFGISWIISLWQFLKWRTWFFSMAMFCGYLSEMIGYGGRVILWQNPFSFPGFLMQIICITLGPAFFSAAIYFTLSKIVIYLGSQHSRFRPNLYYWLFIPCDIGSLSLQSAGGALSSTTSGNSKIGVDIAIAGLSMQVVTLTIFIGLALDYAMRWRRNQRQSGRHVPVSRSFRVFVAFLSLAIILILIRCAYRIDELSDGYSGPLIHNEGLFIGLEGVAIIVAAFCLNIAHPGGVFEDSSGRKVDAANAAMMENAETTYETK